MTRKVRLGILEGLVRQVPDFLEPMSEDELREWEGDPLNQPTVEEGKPACMPHPLHRDDSTDTGSR